MPKEPFASPQVLGSACKAESMSVITAGEQTRLQRQAVGLLDTLLEMAAREDLPAVTWTVGRAGASLVGDVFAHPYTRRREDWNAWKAAITSASGSVPDHEHATGETGGEIRLTASWEHLPVGLTRDSSPYPSAAVALVATIWPDEILITD